MTYDKVLLKNIVNSIMALKDPDDYFSNMERYQAIILAKRGLQQMRYVGTKDRLRRYRDVINEEGIIHIPKDYVDYARISLIGADGMLYPIKVNPRRDISYRYGLNNFNQVVTLDDYSYPVVNNPDNTSEMDYFYDNNGGFIQFTNIISRNVIIEYISDPLKCDEEELGVHKYFVEPLEFYVYYQYIRTKRVVPISERKEAERRYFNSLRNARRMNGAKLEEIYQYMGYSRGVRPTEGLIEETIPTPQTPTPPTATAPPEKSLWLLQNSEWNDYNGLQNNVWDDEGIFDDGEYELTDYFSDEIISWGNSSGFTEFSDYEAYEGVIDFDNAGMTDDDIRGIEYLSNMTELILSQNSLTEINGIKDLINLTRLDLNNNTLTTIDVTNLTMLDELHINNNDLTEVKGIHKLTNLTKLDLSENNLSTGEIDDILSKCKLLYDKTGLISYIILSFNSIPSGGISNPDYIYLTEHGVTVTIQTI